MPRDRFFESFVSSDGYGAIFQSPFFRIFAALLTSLGNSIVDYGESPGEEVWREYFGPAGASVTVADETLKATFFVLYPEENSGSD